METATHTQELIALMRFAFEAEEAPILPAQSCSLQRPVGLGDPTNLLETA